jgi:hypothetical protein
MRLARAAGGGIDYWLGLPVDELFSNMVELIEQLEAEREAQEKR